VHIFPAYSTANPAAQSASGHPAIPTLASILSIKPPGSVLGQVYAASIISCRRIHRPNQRQLRSVGTYNDQVLPQFSRPEPQPQASSPLSFRPVGHDPNTSDAKPTPSAGKHPPQDQSGQHSDPWAELLARPDPGPAHTSAATRDWPGYFRNVANKPPRETLIEALDRFDQAGKRQQAAPPLAIDLGCGEGRDTAELLRRNWRVLAIDGHELAIKLVTQRPDIRELFAEHPDRAHHLEARQILLEDIERLPHCDLLNTSFTLPFCNPEHFDKLWATITAAIKPGGRFAGQLFGDRDDWAKLPDRSHQSRSRVLELLEPFQIETFREEERDGETTDGVSKHWHVFHIVARMPS